MVTAVKSAALKVADGNDKLGKGCVVLSRPVDDTCPPTCLYLGNGCYAEKVEHRFPDSRAAGFHNLRVTDGMKLRAMLIDAIRRRKSVRVHERGDFMRPGS